VSALPLARSAIHNAIAAPTQIGSSNIAASILAHFGIGLEFRIRSSEARCFDVLSSSAAIVAIPTGGFQLRQYRAIRVPLRQNSANMAQLKLCFESSKMNLNSCLTKYCEFHFSFGTSLALVMA
jgi:hypothetical protein